MLLNSLTETNALAELIYNNVPSLTLNICMCMPVWIIVYKNENNRWNSELILYCCSRSIRIFQNKRFSTKFEYEYC